MPPLPKSMPKGRNNVKINLTKLLESKQDFRPIGTTGDWGIEASRPSRTSSRSPYAFKLETVAFVERLRGSK
jgi:hypothetical protein